MSTTRTSTSTPDGRFELRYRCDAASNLGEFFVENWTMFARGETPELARWTGASQEPGEFTEVAFSEDFRAVVARREDGRMTRLEVPQPRVAAPEEAALRAAIFDAPDDDAPRLVYADWLQDREDPRGQLIALQTHQPDHPQAAALIARWRYQWLHDDQLPIAWRSELARGFFTSIDLHAPSEAHLAQFLAAPSLTCLRSLELVTHRQGDGAVARIAACARLAGLRSLRVRSRILTDADLTALAASAQLTRLETIDSRSTTRSPRVACARC